MSILMRLHLHQILKYFYIFIWIFKNYIFKKNLEPKMNDAVIKYIEEESKKYNFDEYSLHLKSLGI